MKNKLLTSLLDWTSSNGIHGYDPYDIMSLNGFTRSLMINFKDLNFFKKIVRFFIERTDQYFPIALRKCLFIKKKVHPTHLGCMLHTYVLLAKSGDQSFDKEIEFYRSKLIEHRSKESVHFAWGVPFSWSSGGVEYTEGTPFAVTANWIGSAFVELYLLKGNQADLDIAISVCEFIVNDLKRTTFDDGTICFSYSNKKVDLINNANLFAADLLIQVGSITSNKEYLEIAQKAVDFSLSTQLDSGLIPYVAHSTSTFNDSYHGSYELQCIYRAWKQFKSDKYLKSFELYFDYYIKYYFQDNGDITKYFNKPFPIDSTSLADALILFAKIRETVDVEKYVEPLIKNLADNWQDKSGYFYYRRTGPNRFVKIPFIRWTQGWMALGLAHWYEE